MRFLPSVFSLALFTSAFLSFSIQPILGKMLLPMVGGAPASWIVAMAFFQLALLAGYGVSYFLGRYSPWVHAAGLFALYISGLYFVPPVLPVLKAEAQGVALSFTVAEALFKTVFIPFLALTATTAALQRVFAATNDPTANDPYYLFMASNIGSFAGLFVYPFLLEPLTGLSWQTGLWKSIYFGAIVLIVVSCLFAWKNKNRTVQAVQAERRGKTKDVPMRTIGMWLVLSFIPCSLSMGVTTLITTDIGGLPLFWVIPLGLYLLTFILAFSPKPFLNKKNADFYHVIAIIFMTLFLGLEVGYQPSGELVIFVFLALLLLYIFFFSAWACHQKLADSRPDPKHLALFYFVIAVGGGMAGILHAFVIPFVFPGLIEFPLMILLSVLVVKKQIFNMDHWSKKSITTVARIMTVIGLGALVISFVLRQHEVSRSVYSVFSFVFLFMTLLMAIKPRYLLILGLAALITSTQSHYPGHVIETKRNFFGVHAVYEIKKNKEKIRLYAHGNTIHGVSVVNDNKMIVSDTAYYTQKNPIRDVLTISHAKNIAVIGLGAGQLACYDRRLTVDFYEIDEDVERIARNYFPYLRKCPVRDIFIGDGRVMLEKMQRRYDVILIDAFSSDSIPLHLVTREAIQSYKKRLRKGGMILFHISNRYLDLAPPLAAIAQDEKISGYKKLHTPADTTAWKQKSYWFVMTSDPSTTKALERMKWKTEKPQDYIWTDDRSSLLSAFQWRGPGN